MDADRLTEILRRLERLDERYLHKLRPHSPTLSGSDRYRAEQTMRELAAYTLELKELLRELLEGLGARPSTGLPN